MNAIGDLWGGGKSVSVFSSPTRSVPSRAGGGIIEQVISMLVQVTNAHSLPVSSSSARAHYYHSIPLHNGTVVSGGELGN